MMADRRRLTSRAWRLAAILGGLLFSLPAQCELTSAQSLERRLLLDAADGELDEHDFIAATLIASGVASGEELAKWRRDYESIVAATELPDAGTLDDRLQAIQTALHERFLIGRYVASASDLRTTIARGDYNCLTALAIHWDLCCRSGLSLEIGAQPGHVHLLLAEGIAIEPGASRPTGQHQSSVSRASRRLTVPELLGKFYYNRGVEQLRSGQFQAGLALLETSLQLDPADRDARENLAAGFNNWAVEQCRRERYDLAAPLIAQGLAIEPAFAPLVANRRLVREKLSP